MVQDRQLSIWKAKISSRNLLWLAKLAVTTLILIYIINTFRNEQKGISDIGQVFGDMLTGRNLPVLVLMLLLVPVNWALESLKWRQLASKVAPLTFGEAFMGTLTGLAIGVAAPAQLGDTIGRIVSLKSENRMQAIGAAIVSNGIQFYVSVIFGAAGWLYMQEALLIPAAGKRTITILLFFTLLAGVTIGLVRERLRFWSPRNKHLIRLHSYIQVAGEYTNADLALSTFLGALRYSVFLIQFVLALSLFDFQIAYKDLAACVTLIFLSKTLIPAINILGDLGLREFTALVVFSHYHLPAEQIIAATFMVWIVNVLGPILVGMTLIWKNKWKLATLR